MLVTFGHHPLLCVTVFAAGAPSAAAPGSDVGGGTGTPQCTFTVTRPNVTTANGTRATITPTISGTNFT